MREYKLKIELPFLKKGAHFFFEDDTGEVYALLDGMLSEHSLRLGLAQYLWLLLTDGGKYLKRVR